MYTMTPTGNLSHAEWLALRKTGIGGSDADALCGLNAYRSPIHVYKDKVSEEIEDFDNESMRQGRDLEEYVARRFIEETGLKVRRSNMMYRSKKYPFMLADVDRLIVGEDAGLECKTASAYNADKWKEGAIPDHYLIQCYHYMAVTGKKAWYIAVVIFGVGFRYKKIEWDDNIINNLITIEKVFWEQNVQKRLMPDPDGSRVLNSFMTQQEFLTINIQIVKERRNIAYKLFDGVIITFLNNKNKYNLLLNGHEVERGQNYSNWAIRNSFLFIKNSMCSFQLYPFSDGKTYAKQYVLKQTVIVRFVA